MKIKTYEDGSARLLWPWRDIALTTADFKALREYFQAERDEELGRWRDTENPNIVVYALSMMDGEDRCIRLLNELSGATWLDWGRVALPGPASRYFEAHPEPEPRPPFAAYVDKNGSAVWVTDENG